MFADTTLYRTLQPIFRDPRNNQLWFDPLSGDLEVMDADGVIHVVGGGGGLTPGPANTFLVTDPLGTGFAWTEIINLRPNGMGPGQDVVNVEPNGFRLLSRNNDPNEDIQFWGAAAGSWVFERFGSGVGAFGFRSVDIRLSGDAGLALFPQAPGTIAHGFEAHANNFLQLVNNSSDPSIGGFHVELGQVFIGDPLTWPTGTERLVVGDGVRLSGTLVCENDIDASGLPGAPGSAGTLWVDAGAGNVVKRA